MRLLLDTHVLLWALLDSRRIPPRVAAALLDPANEVAVSAVSAWEIAIKQSLEKLVLPGPAETWLAPEVARAGFAWAPVSPEDALRVRALPWHHRDPFDRLLVAQAMAGWTIATADPWVQTYGVPSLWA